VLLIRTSENYVSVEQGIYNFALRQAAAYRDDFARLVDGANVATGDAHLRWLPFHIILPAAVHTLEIGLDEMVRINGNDATNASAGEDFYGGRACAASADYSNASAS